MKIPKLLKLQKTLPPLTVVEISILWVTKSKIINKAKYAERFAIMEKLRKNEPTAEVLMNSMRAIGYSFESSIADIIDNSISASAKNAPSDTLCNSILINSLLRCCYANNGTNTKYKGKNKVTR